MAYALESADEFKRLEKQSTRKNYSVNNEIGEIEIRDNDIILDAGCGSGLLCRYLRNKNSKATIFGCDFSTERILEAKKNSDSINFFTSDLESIQKGNNSFSKVFCRYVFEHLQNPQKVANELYRVTQDGGEVTVINVDSIMFDIFSFDEKLNEGLEKIRKSKLIDIFAGRKIPYYLHQAGFKNIDWDITPMIFKNENLEKEIELVEERLLQSEFLFEKVFNSKEIFWDFKFRYLNRIKDRSQPFFYNKFIVRAKK